MEKTTAKPTKKKTTVALHAVGRRKEATCTLNMVRGEGENMVNGKKLEEYFPRIAHKAAILTPFVVTNTLGHYHFTSKVSGGGLTGQADALKLSIARALAASSEEMHVMLSQASLLTRDPRAKERKKVFFVRARKRPQYSKR